MVATLPAQHLNLLIMDNRLTSASARFDGEALRVLIIPGLHDSGEAHWQSWLQTQYKGAVRVRQQDWATPDLDAWAERIAQTLSRPGRQGSWVAVAHSFGTLALARYLAQQQTRQREQPAGQGVQAPGRIVSALLVAPADPNKFDVAHRLPERGLGIPATVIGSENDPWMPLSRAQHWARQWGAGFINLGEAGHINTDSGFGPWPLARFKVDQLIRDQQRQRRLDRAHPMELSYAV
jgi:predicted alpha/beta hydrolase family esterase